MESLSILVLDDEKVFRDEISEFLENDGFNVFAVGLPSQAFNMLEKQDIDIMILDLRLPEMDGFAVLELVKQKHPAVEVIMITGHGDMDTVIQAMRMGTVEFFPKPFRLLDMKTAIQRTRRYIELSHRLQNVSQSFAVIAKDLSDSIGCDIVGQSKAVQRVLELMRKVACSDSTSVLITGESGTGKELVARGIHHLSTRGHAYFHAVNCSAIPDTLFESEFFGHKKGAYTGALEDRPGWFEVANGGTLFLDEIVDMQQSMQSKLLRVLEDRKIRRLGTSNDIPIDVRVIAATNQNSKELIENGKFRSDLYFRINSFEINVPPLRERPEDIPLLLDYYVGLFSRRMKRRLVSIDENVMSAAMGYSFPGNIRELRNMVERALILADGDRLTLNEFPFAKKVYTSQEMEQMEHTESLDLEEVEKRAIIRAMKRTDNKKTDAAILLNITRQSLDRRIEKHGLQF